MNIKSIVAVIVFLMLTLSLQSQELDFDQILYDLDNTLNFQDKDFSCTYTIVSNKPGEEEEVSVAKMFRRDNNAKFVIVLKAPDHKKGQGYLQVDDNLWFYDPSSRKFEHTSLKEAFQNSDAKNADFTQSTLSEDYEVVSAEEGKLGKYPVHILNLSALHDEVSYPTMKVWVRKDLNIALKSESFGHSGRLMRTAVFLNYVRVGEQLIPSRMLFVDNLNEGEKTQITMEKPSLSNLPDSVFSKAYLERVNK